ncbi:protein translocase subunit SecF [Haloechinothrix salitolerans]|uniref:Protein-export membrane protein SecF n=1 Tax=Haloechinothrix salitolerans TaxID=926830 RepID=A0ABW2C218_9PSEU
MADSTGTTERTEAAARPAKQGRFAKLYLGTGGFGIVGRSRTWYVTAAVIMLICVGSIVFRGFTPGIEFVGGTQIQLPAQGAEGPISADEVEDVYADTFGKVPASTQLIGSGGSQSVQVRSETLDVGQIDQLKRALFDELKPIGADGEPTVNAISDSGVSGSWGDEITKQALIALAVFLVLVMIFLAVYFERWMAVAALAALVFDLTVTPGVYSLIGFEVTPATVIGLLTILGYSLYDTVVVFDKVKENTKGLLDLSRQTYPESANLALNQTLMRSINTSLTSLLPVLGLLLIGAGLLGAGTLKDLALVQAIGIVAGTLSSIFLATPVLVDLKMREPAYQEQAQRVESRRTLGKRTASQTARATAGLSDTDGDTDDEAHEAELRKEKAFVAASAVPGRNLKKSDQRRLAGKPTGKSAGKPTGKRGR